MEDKTGVDERFTRYLLGDLPEEESVRLEEKYFTDDEAFERLLAAREDLADAYARGELAGAERERFERHFLSTSPRRLGVSKTKELIDFSTRVASAGAVSHEGKGIRHGWLSFLYALGSPSPALGLTLAALLLVTALLGVWLFLGRSNSTRTEQAGGVPSASPEIASERQPDDASSSPKDGRAENLETPPKSDTPVPAPRRTPAPESASNRPDQAKARQAQVASITLAPLLTRSSGGQNILLIRPETRAARLRLAFTGENYPSYIVVLRTVEGEQVWRSARLKARLRNEGKTVTIQVSTEHLRRKDYIVTLSGVTNEGETKEISEYFFTVDKGESP